MSGTSLDGIDVAMIETDGQGIVRPDAAAFFPYDTAFRDEMRNCLGNPSGTQDPKVREAEIALTKKHAEAVRDFLETYDINPKQIDLIGFHGQTIWHNPEAKQTIQIGDGKLLATQTRIDVVNDFRTADVQAGGQGAPLVPLYHRALAHDLPKPVAIINIGGVSNVTWIGSEGDDQIFAFDLGPGNALIDDWVSRQAGLSCDKNGKLAAAGKVDQVQVAAFLSHPYFQKEPPKSLDRDAFADFAPKECSTEDGAATLTMMTVRAVVHGLTQMPLPAQTLYVTGGGRHNKTMMAWLAQESGLSVQSVDALGWDGDAMEAQAFAYLAVRSHSGLPLSVPGTTSVPAPMTGGRYHKAKN
jgi:anhydro-N-acetylmuramic acid kinase